MARQVYVFRGGKCIPIEEAGDYAERTRTQIITDDMPPTKHMCDGRIYTSKSKFRNTTKLFGCVEIGDQPLPKKEARKDPTIKRDLLKAWDESGN
jgi:hypothetical protein